MDVRVQKVVELVVVGIKDGRAPGLDVVCRSVNLSRSRIRHLFKTELGLTFGQYVRLKQMEYAKTLLESSFLNVKQVMSCTGFNDESHFVRDFKRFYGYSPAKYRKHYWQSAGLDLDRDVPVRQVP